MKVIYIDVETTGIPFPQSGLVQLAGAIEIDGEVRRHFNFRMRPFPGDVVSDEALALNGLTLADLETYDEPATVFEQFVAMLGEYIDRYDRADKFHFVGYNAQFDADHLRAWFEKNNDQFFGSWFWHPPVDVMALAAIVLMPNRAALDNFRLPTVATMLGLVVDEDKTHDALYDMHLTRELFHQLLGYVRSEGVPGWAGLELLKRPNAPKSNERGVS